MKTRYEQMWCVVCAAFVLIFVGVLSQEMQKMFTRYKSVMMSVNLRARDDPELQERLAGMNRDWSRACTDLQQWDTGLRKTLVRSQVRRSVTAVAFSLCFSITEDRLFCNRFSFFLFCFSLLSYTIRSINIWTLTQFSSCWLCTPPQWTCVL